MLGVCLNERVACERLSLIAIVSLFLSGCCFEVTAPEIVVIQPKSSPEAVVENSKETHALSKSVVPEKSEQAATELPEPTAGEPSPDQPVKAAMQVRPPTASPGDTIELLIVARIARAHYLHADAADSTFTSVTAQVSLPEGIEAVGDWVYPDPKASNGNHPIYRDSIRIKRQLRILSDAPSRVIEFKGKLGYQACTDELCWPPAELELSASLFVPSSTR